jgi:hypothetical protein
MQAAAPAKVALAPGNEPLALGPARLQLTAKPPLEHPGRSIAQNTPFGRGTGGRADEQAAVYIGG